MALQTLVAMTIEDLNLAETIVQIESALSDCQSVKGLYSIQRLRGASYRELKRERILSAPEGGYADQGEIANIEAEIDDSTQGLEARWEVSRYRRSGSEMETWSHYFRVRFEPASHRSDIFTGIADDWFIDAGEQRHFLPTRMEHPLAAEAAAMNLELLAEELAAIAAIPVKRLSGIPVHSIDPDCQTPLSALWLLFDGETHRHDHSDLGIQHTDAGPLYYSHEGPLGDLASLQLVGSL